MKATKLFKRLKKASQGIEVSLPSPKRLKDYVSDFVWLVYDGEDRQRFLSIIVSYNDKKENISNSLAMRTLSYAKNIIYNDYQGYPDVGLTAKSIMHAINKNCNDEYIIEFVKEMQKEYF